MDDRAIGFISLAVAMGIEMSAVSHVLVSNVVRSLLN